MRLFKRGRIWWAQFQGTRTSLGVTDKTAAELAFRELQRSAADPSYRPAGSALCLREALAGFIERQREKGRAPGTIAMYELHARWLNQILGKETNLAMIDAAEIERYLSVRQRDGKASSSTRWKELCTLRGVLKRARKLKQYPHHLADVMPDDAQPAYTPGTRHLLLPDVHKMLAELDPERRAVAAFIVGTSADISSVWRAVPGDIDLKGGTVVVRGSKTRHRDRVVPILDVFRPLLVEAAKGLPFEPWVNVRRDLMRACARAKVTECTARDLRRSHGRILRVAGIAPQLIGPMMGHAPGSPVTALSYAQIQPAELAALINAGTKTVHSKPKRAKKTAKAAHA